MKFSIFHHKVQRIFSFYDSFTSTHHIQFTLLNTFPLLVLMSSNLFDRWSDWFVGKLQKYINIKRSWKTACLSVSDGTGNSLPIFVNGQEDLYRRWFSCESIVICQQRVRSKSAKFYFGWEKKRESCEFTV